jgi:hypothetical protein
VKRRRGLLPSGALKSIAGLSAWAGVGQNEPDPYRVPLHRVKTAARVPWAGTVGGTAGWCTSSSACCTRLLAGTGARLALRAASSSVSASLQSVLPRATRRQSLPLGTRTGEGPPRGFSLYDASGLLLLALRYSSATLGTSLPTMVAGGAQSHPCRERHPRDLCTAIVSWRRPAAAPLSSSAGCRR